ncbi:MAG: DUF58 domain-containing protein [Gammaproteobacteria bacterium]|nr:DUF58 domain-containing protein [Gammaproteobacteria bacterium]
MNLTRLSYVIAVLIAALGIIGEWQPNAISALWRLLAATWVVLLLLEWYLARRTRLSVARAIKPGIHLGRPGDLNYTIRNASPRRLRMRSMDQYPMSVHESPPILEWSIAANDSQRRQERITPTQLGPLAWDVMQLRILGFFGLAWWSRQQQVQTTTEVIPDRLYSHEQVQSATAHQGDITRRVHGIGTELIALREYQPGDPLHFIDWKASARSQRTMVRLFSDEQHLELMIVIDAGRTSSMQAGSLTRLGHYINVASRLAQKALLNGDQIGIVIFADTVLASMHRLKGHHGLQRLRTILAQVTSVARESNPLPAILRVRQLASLRSLVVMLTDLDDGDAAAQLVKAMGILQPKHQPLLAAISDSDVRKLGEAEASAWLDPYHGLAASEMLQNWRHTRVRLERMGIPVVLSDIRYLDKQVLDSYDHLKQRYRI